MFPLVRALTFGHSIPQTCANCFRALHFPTQAIKRMTPYFSIKLSFCQEDQHFSSEEMKEFTVKESAAKFCYKNQIISSCFWIYVQF